ncbi:hypothetical protein ACFQ9V_05445 [Leifsonia sp. NPDC056665]|uniref:hypothetical protein n=1 Tax=Leifsonia sp. NPDC056665 TaxID=3345901 RepID=UPI0036784987
MQTPGPLGYNSNRDRPYLIRGRDDVNNSREQAFMVAMRRDEASENSWDWFRYDALVGTLIHLGAILIEEQRFSEAGKTLAEALNLLRLFAPSHPGSAVLKDQNRVHESICLYNGAVLFLEYPAGSPGPDKRLVGLNLLREALSIHDSASGTVRERELYTRTDETLARVRSLA